MDVQRITTPSGEEMVILPARDFEALVAARDHAAAMAAYRRGEDEGVTEAEMDAYLAAATPLAFWRGKRGLTQAVLAALAGISQPYLAQLETGGRKGGLGTYRALARGLGIALQDLMPG